MMVPKWTIAAAALTFGASAAHARCDLTSFRVSNGEVFARYDPFEASASPVDVPLDTSGSTDCRGDRVSLTLEADPSTPFALDGAVQLRSGGEILQARLGDSSGRPINSAFSGGRPSASLRFGATGDIRAGALKLILPPGQEVPPGTYTARLVATAEVIDDQGERSASRQAQFGIAVTVLPAVGLAAGSGTTLDLGTIHAGGTADHPVSFRAYANTGYRLKLTSDHDFALTLNGQRKGARIDYVPLLGTQEVDPGPSGTAFTDPGTRGFREHVLNVRVPRVSHPPAGIYSDYITVEISATVAG